MDDFVLRCDAAADRPQRARDQPRVLDVAIEDRRRRNAVVSNAGQLPILAGAERNGLDGRRLVAGHRIHLRARQLQTHWATQNLRRERRQDRMRPDISLAAEATAQEGRYDIDLFLGYAEHDRQKLPGAEDVLGRLIERERRV